VFSLFLPCTCLVPSLVPLLSPSRLSPERCYPRMMVHSRRDFHFSSPNLVSPTLTSIRFTLCLVHPRTTATSIKYSKISPISNTMRNWDEDSPPQSHASSKSKQESDQISASTQQFKMESTSSSKKTPNDLDLSKATTYHEKNTELTGSTVTASAAQAPFDPAARKKLLRKLDRHLIPFLALIYLQVA
jgi:hypothetical protein